VFYVARGLVVGDTSLGRERDLVPSLVGVGGERVVLLSMWVCFLSLLAVSVVGCPIVRLFD
jgi:hypothetical protein